MVYSTDQGKIPVPDKPSLPSNARHRYHAPVNRSSRSLLSLVVGCFFISGVAGLVYQVVWARYLALFLGHTSYAVVAVLVAFMGGLALGNFWLGQRADRTRKPLALYGWLELGIAIYALAFPAYFNRCHDGFVKTAQALAPGSASLLLLKFGFSLLLVLLPTILMGATFPVLTRFVTLTLALLRQRVAALYAINSAGAVVGCLVADFWWVPAYGLELSLYFAAGLNAVAGLVALIASVRIETGPAITHPVALSPAQEPATETYSLGEHRLALFAIGVSGFVAMLYEVAWTRLLGLALGSSTHAFSLMLVTFITGIALGAWLVCLWKGQMRSLVAFAWAELGLALTLFVSLFFYQYLSFWFVSLAGLLARKEAAYALYSLAQAAICFLVMLVPAICLGMTLPLISRIATADIQRVGHSVGMVFAVNTLGTVLGAVLTGLWIMPSLGLAQTFVVGVVLNLGIGLLALTWRQLERQRRALVIPFLIVAAVVWFCGSRLDPVWQRALSMGLWRTANIPPNAAAFRASAAAIPLQYHRDGASATVDVYSWQEGSQSHLTLKVNGKADAGNSTDMITQLLLGHIPMLLRPGIQQVLVIGLGSGMTCGAVARHPTVERVDAVEISPEVVAGARLFAAYNDAVLDNPRFHLALEDAKSFLKITDRQYDLIVSEPSNPWMAGVAGVFSREYYEDCAARLKPEGIVAQWMHIYETTDETVEMVLRTFMAAFPYASVWQPAVGDLVLIGSRQPLRVDLERTRERFELPPIKADLARVDLLTLPTVLAREIIPQQNGLFTVSTTGPIHSDFFPELEYMAQRGFFLNRIADQWRLYREDFSPRATTWFGTYLQRHPLTEDDFRAFVRDFQEHRIPEPRLFRSLLFHWQGDSNRLAFPIDLWPASSDRSNAAELRVLRLHPFLDGFMTNAAVNPDPLLHYALDLMETYRAQRSVFHVPPTHELEPALHRLLECDPPRKRLYRLYLAELAWDKGRDAECLELGRAALDPDVAKAGPIDFTLDSQAASAVLYRMTESLWRAGRVAEAWALCQQAAATGFLQQSQATFPLLGVTYRRIEAAVAQSAPTGTALP